MSLEKQMNNNIAVVGLWHTGVVTAACLASAGFNVLGYDSDEKTITELQQGHSPIFEPGLETLLQEGIDSGKLIFSTQSHHLKQSNIVWITFDTPIDANDTPDPDQVINTLLKLLPELASNTLLLISSQLPVGSTKLIQEHLAQHFPEKNISCAYSPENLRLGKAIESFCHQDRIVVGIATDAHKLLLEKILRPFCQRILWMSISSAEMTKHAINVYLATSVTLTNEIAVLCERVGANASEVEQGLRTEARIGSHAYVRAGGAFAGGTLARDIVYLMQTGQQAALSTPLIDSLLISNQKHREWSQRKLVEILGNLSQKTITLLGLAYKAGTNTLRRSAAIETAEWLKQQGACVTGYDPLINTLPKELNTLLTLKNSVQAACQHADAVIIATEWPEFMTLTADELCTWLPRPLIFDPSAFLAKKLRVDKRIRYFSVGQGG